MQKKNKIGITTLLAAAFAVIALGVLTTPAHATLEGDVNTAVTAATTGYTAVLGVCVAALAAGILWKLLKRGGKSLIITGAVGLGLGSSAFADITEDVTNAVTAATTGYTAVLGVCVAALAAGILWKLLKRGGKSL